MDNKIVSFLSSLVLIGVLVFFISKKKDFSFFEPPQEYAISSFEQKAIEYIEGVYGKNSGLKRDIVYCHHDVVKVRQGLEYKVYHSFLAQGFGGSRAFVLTLRIESTSDGLEVTQYTGKELGKCTKCPESVK